MSEQTKVIIVDDHQILIEGIKLFLSENDEFEFVAGVKSGKELMDLLDAGTIPDILILDMIMPEMNGIDVLKELKSDFPEINTLIFSGQAPHQMFVEALNEGALGILPKDAGMEEIEKALSVVRNGEQYFGNSISREIIKTLIGNTDGKKAKRGDLAEKLTNREIDIVKYISKGLTAKEIASSLNISTNTVETHRNNILKKLQLKSSIDLVKYALRNNIVALEDI